MKFTDLETAQKGRAGELFAMRFFHSRNIPLYPTWGEGSHPADFIMQGRESLAYVEVKTYPRRYIAAQTGIDLDDWNKYRKLSARYGVPFYLVFIDVFEWTMYGALISELEPFAQVDGLKVYFSLRLMHMIKKLTAQDLEQLPEIEAAQRYRNVKPYFWLESNRIRQPIKRGIGRIRTPKKARVQPVKVT